ncbi:hypothetical protein C6946_32580, partial [Burkholderia thailandensis]
MAWPGRRRVAAANRRTPRRSPGPHARPDRRTDRGNRTRTRRRASKGQPAERSRDAHAHPPR